MLTTWKVLRSLAGIESNSHCRRCSEAISHHDPFGRGEGVCAPCRSHA